MDGGECHAGEQYLGFYTILFQSASIDLFADDKNVMLLPCAEQERRNIIALRCCQLFTSSFKEREGWAGFMTGAVNVHQLARRHKSSAHAWLTMVLGNKV